jgi:hypothetical protein
MNCIEPEVEGLRPDAGTTGGLSLYGALRALGYPRLVLLTHWDRFNVGCDVAQQAAIERLRSFISELKAASPRTEVIVPKYFEPVAVESARQLENKY